MFKNIVLRSMHSLGEHLLVSVDTVSILQERFFWQSAPVLRNEGVKEKNRVDGEEEEEEVEEAGEMRSKISYHLAFREDEVTLLAVGIFLFLSKYTTDVKKDMPMSLTLKELLKFYDNNQSGKVTLFVFDST